MMKNPFDKALSLATWKAKRVELRNGELDLYSRSLSVWPGAQVQSIDSTVYTVSIINNDEESR